MVSAVDRLPTDGTLKRITARVTSTGVLVDRENPALCAANKLSTERALRGGEEHVLLLSSRMAVGRQSVH